MSEDNVIIERRDAIVTITINRPDKRNALSRSMKGQLADTFADLSADDNVSVIVIRGAGREAFCAGADLSEFDPSESPEDRRRANEATTARCFRAIKACPKPVIAMVYGFAMGAGCALAMACDLRLAADSAKFGVPAAKLGIVYPPEVTANLVRLVGPSNAAQILFTAAAFDARTCKEMGLATLVFPDDSLEDESYRLARQIAENDPEGVAVTKGALAACFAQAGTRA